MENEEELEKIKSIAESIQNGKCILVLGPEICQIDHKILGTNQACDFEESLKLAYEYYINKKIDKSVSIEANSKLIEFDGDTFLKEKLWVSDYKNDLHLLKFAQWYFEHTVGWEQTFEKLSQLCFPLIISLLPDTHLEQTFEKQDRDFYLSRYSRKNKDVTAINFSFTKEKPLIYKLLGDIKARDASFSFDHWFEFFRNLFREAPSLPEPIINSLRDAELILFVGVRVEKWYIQLLVKYLYTIVAENPEGLAYAKIKEHQDTKLATKRLSIVFDEKDPVKLIDEIFAHSKNQNWLCRKATNDLLISAKVFISYNHNDSVIAHQLKADLEKKGINVIIDTDNPIGFEIPKFINESIKKADFIIQLISENFLTSAWVAQESIKAFSLAELTGKTIMPYEIDDVLEDTIAIAFRQKAMLIFETKLKVLREEMQKRLDKDESTDDLEPRRRRLLQLKNNYDAIILEFQNKNRGNLRAENYEKGFETIISSIQTYQANAQ